MDKNDEKIIRSIVAEELDKRFDKEKKRDAAEKKRDKNRFAKLRDMVKGNAAALDELERLALEDEEV